MNFQHYCNQTLPTQDLLHRRALTQQHIYHGSSAVESGNRRQAEQAVFLVLYGRKLRSSWVAAGCPNEQPATAAHICAYIDPAQDRSVRLHLRLHFLPSAQLPRSTRCLVHSLMHSSSIEYTNMAVAVTTSIQVEAVEVEAVVVVAHKCNRFEDKPFPACANNTSFREAHQLRVKQQPQHGRVWLGKEKGMYPRLPSFGTSLTCT